MPGRLFFTTAFGASSDTHFTSEHFEFRFLRLLFRFSGAFELYFKAQCSRIEANLYTLAFGICIKPPSIRSTPSWWASGGVRYYEMHSPTRSPLDLSGWRPGAWVALYVAWPDTSGSWMRLTERSVRNVHRRIKKKDSFERSTSSGIFKIVIVAFTTALIHDKPNII